MLFRSEPAPGRTAPAEEPALPAAEAAACAAAAVLPDATPRRDAHPFDTLLRRDWRQPLAEDQDNRPVEAAPIAGPPPAPAVIPTFEGARPEPLPVIVPAEAAVPPPAPAGPATVSAPASLPPVAYGLVRRFAPASLPEIGRAHV